MDVQFFEGGGGGVKGWHLIDPLKSRFWHRDDQDEVLDYPSKHLHMCGPHDFAAAKFLVVARIFPNTYEPFIRT